MLLKILNYLFFINFFLNIVFLYIILSLNSMILISYFLKLNLLTIFLIFTWKMRILALVVTWIYRFIIILLFLDFKIDYDIFFFLCLIDIILKVIIFCRINSLFSINISCSNITSLLLKILNFLLRIFIFRSWKLIYLRFLFWYSTCFLKCKQIIYHMFIIDFDRIYFSFIIIWHIIKILKNLLLMSCHFSKWIYIYVLIYFILLFIKFINNLFLLHNIILFFFAF